MDESFSKDIIPSFSKETKKENTSYIETLISDIGEELNKVDDKDYVNNIINNVNNLIDNYNESLNEKEELLVVEGKVYKKIILQRKLLSILDNIKNMQSSLKLNYDLKDYLNNILDVLNNKDSNINDDLIEDIKKIVEDILPLLNNDLQLKYKRKINEIIDNEINIINENKNLIYNGEKGNNITIDNIKLKLRKNIQVLLINLNKDNLNNNEIDKILKNTIKIMNNNYKNNNKYKAYFVSINDLYEELKDEVSTIELYEIILIDEINLKNVINKLYELKFQINNNKKIKKLKLR